MTCGAATIAAIGRGNLARICLESAIERGHHVVALVTTDPDLAQWATTKGVAIHATVKKLIEALGDGTIEYLFSISNYTIIKSDILGKVARFAINYHDGPLPKYAGLYATSWALLHRETTHGITWHTIDTTIDTGGILVQRIFDVPPDDTATSLNMRCFEHAAESFRELLTALEAGTLAPKKQEGERSYFGLADKPRSLGFVDLARTTAEIWAMHRALSFGPYWNPLTAPKVWLDRPLVVNAVTRLDGAAANAGEVIDVDAESVVVGTGDGAVRLGGLVTFGGDRAALDPGLVGRRIGLPPSIERAHALAQELGKSESFWRERLRDPRPIPLVQAAGSGGWRRVEVSLPSNDNPVAVLAAHGAFFARIGDVDSFDVHYTSDALRETIRDVEWCFAEWVRFRIPKLPHTWTELVQALWIEAEQVKRHRTFARDLAYRDPELRTSSADLPIAFVSGAFDEAARGTCPASLVVVVEEGGACTWWVDEARLPIEEATRLARAFERFSARLEGPGELRDISLLGPEDESLFAAINATDAPLDGRTTLYGAFLDQAEATPDNVAVTCGGRSWTYSALRTRAEAIATVLAGGPGATVAVLVDRSLELVATLLAILKTGAAYLPLDPAYPENRIRFMLEDSGATEIVLDTGRRHVIPTLPDGCKPVLLAAIPNSLAGARGPASGKRDPQADLAYVIYTSGTTGAPKGVEIFERAVVNFLRSMKVSPGFRSGDVLLSVTTVSFDIAVLELFLPLLNGGQVVLATRDETIDGRKLARLVADHHVTVMQATPATWTMLIESGWTGAPGLKVLCGGEPLTASLAEQLLPRCAELWNMYGPTETTIWSTISRVTDPANITVGRPIANTQVYVVDKHYRPVPVGATGELCIAGAGLARGYRKRNTLTAEKFIEGSFGKAYRTGDLARLLPSGDLDCLGRVDTQIKLRGFRIEIGEIESVLCKHPAIATAVVVLREDRPGDKRLHAYYVLRDPAAAPTAEELRQHLARDVPPFMLPSAFHAIEQLPLTPNRKVDRRSLAMRAAPVVLDDELPPPSSSGTVRERLSAIWRALLNVDLVDPGRTFFDQGGTSLYIGRMQARIQQEFGIDVSAAELFGYSMLVDLASHLEEKLGVRPSEAVLPAAEAAPEVDPNLDEKISEIAAAPPESVRSLLLAKLMDVDGDIED